MLGSTDTIPCISQGDLGSWKDLSSMSCGKTDQPGKCDGD